MSSSDSTDKRMGLKEANKVVRDMLKHDSSCLIIRGHCQEQMRKRGMNYRDVINTLLGGNCTGVEEHMVSGLNVYRFETENYRVECNVFKYKNIVVITAINKRSKL